MALKVGIVGLTNSGKTTIFNCFSQTKADISMGYANKSNFGQALVPDKRLYELAEVQPTQKIIHTAIEFVDIPGLRKGGAKGEGSTFLNDIRNVDALIHVVRCFDDPNVPHIEGSVDPVRDIETLDIELQQKDLDSIEKRLDKIEKKAQFGDKEAQRVVAVLHKAKEHLENLQNLRTLGLSEQEKELIADLFLLTLKPTMYVCNVDDASAATGNEYSEKVKEYLKDYDPEAEVLVIAARLEAEIAELDPEDQKEFLADAGLTEPAVNKLIQAAYKLLDLQTFFTVGPKEIRAWTIRRGMKAPDAAGVIHSDLKRGFIRAEVMHYDDFIELGSEQACKQAGKFYLEGKDYVVQEGDILHIRFNV